MIGLYWLQRKAKQLSTPELVFVPALPSAGGYFYRPERAELFINGKPYSLRKGVLMVVENVDMGILTNSIAHEWRHYWQWFNLGRYLHSEEFNTKVDYKREIQRFFKHPRELDALIFSYKVAPCWVSELWISWLKEKRDE